MENKKDYLVHNDWIQKTMSAESSTDTEAKLYLTCNSSLITLILLNSGIMTLRHTTLLVLLLLASQAELFV